MSAPVPEVGPTTAVVSVAQTAPAASPIGTITAWVGAFIAIATAVAIVYKLITRDLGRDVAEVRKEVGSLDHKVNNERTRINALEHQRHADIERIVRVETSIAGVEKLLGRIDSNVNDRFDQIAQSIREIRIVAPR